MLDLASSTVIAMGSLHMQDDSHNDHWPNGSAFGRSWGWLVSSSTLPPSQVHFGACGDNFDIRHVFPPSPHSSISEASRVEATPSSAPSALPTTSRLAFTPLSRSDSTYSSQPAPVERLVIPDDSPASSNEVLHSPFRDCIGTFGSRRSQFFSLPRDGKVNGYVKFSWPRDKRAKQTLTGRTGSISDANRVIEFDDVTDISDGFASQSAMTLDPSQAPSRSEDSAELTVNVSRFYSQPSAVNTTSHTPVDFTPSTVLSNTSTEIVSMGAPKLLPSQYGLEAKMDDTDRRFWMFYIRNWCPGRSTLRDTNLWLKDFAQMHKSLGVRSAIQSLAGIYIYDYLPLDSIRNRVNQRFLDAEERYSQLLNDPATDQDEAQATELITIAVILSMQDIVLTERRLKKPFSPRWLQGCRQGEQLLEATDHGSRFWKRSNIQSSSLRISQSIIVGRAVILAQPMSSLPLPHKFNAQEEASRFGWLLHGADKDMYKIHGGCGFSKKLLHIMGQITYCAARLQQEPLTTIVPVTAKYLYAQLREMRQWSSESTSWENAKFKPLTIKWIRSRPKGYQIDTNASMTDVTAEAWRFAAILYLHCRVFRLPRNHPEVVSKLDELAKCIAIMPTSGTHFTAQAPLFPVFLLGVLATVPEHKAVSNNWFNEVLQTPVRSSVPPLHTALLHIWSWIDEDIPLSSPPTLGTDQPIHLRLAWWEHLVTRVQAQEQEVLCLT